jgi:hypothetical protein
MDFHRPSDERGGRLCDLPPGPIPVDQARQEKEQGREEDEEKTDPSREPKMDMVFNLLSGRILLYHSQQAFISR